MAAQQSYSGGGPALAFNDKGVGFGYYKNGKIALAVNELSDYQTSCFAYDSNKKGTLLLALDGRNGVGYIQTSASMDIQMSLTMTEKGVLLMKDNRVTKEWQWAHAKGQPKEGEPIIISMSENLKFTYNSRSQMSCDFENEGIKYTVNCGVKQKRKEPDYLSTARRGTAGKIIPKSLDVVKSLKQRTEDFNKEMLAKHNLVHPKSCNLSGTVSPIVAKLEGTFDDMDKRMMTSPGPGNTWKGEAFNTTIKELPRIPLAGTETGRYTGFGERIYSSDSPEEMMKTRMSSQPEHLITAKGKWKNDTDVHDSLLHMNPVLKRSNILKCNSGRYSRLAVVDANNITVANPTGMLVPVGDPLDTISWKALKAENAQGGGAELTVCVVGRVGQPSYMALLRMADLANMMMKDMPELAGVKLVRVDAGEDTSIIRELNLRYLPTFVAFRKGACVYSGQFGGHKVQTFEESARPQILIVEANPKHQMSMEKTLRKLSCDSFLCLSAGQALDRLRQISRSAGEGKTQLVFDLVLVAQDLQVSQMQDMAALGKQLEQFTSTGRTVVAATIDVLGPTGHENQHSVPWSKKYLSTECTALLKQPLINYAKVLVQKPLKQTSVEQLIAMRKNADGDSYLGVTPANIIKKIKSLKDMPTVARTNDIETMRLSVQDTEVGGRTLVE